MSKKLKNLKWETVAMEGFPVNITANLQGFVGLEECTEYGFDKESKRAKKMKAPKKRKQSKEPVEKVVPNKKVKLSNGFIVESCTQVAPSLTNEEIERTTRKKKKNKKKVKTATNDTNAMNNTPEKSKENMKYQNVKKIKVKLGEDISQHICTSLTPEDMLTWAEFKLPEPILKALTELGYKKPTKIQQLVLPAAIHGRRDILGAAETGSGKTLAFGLPILTGIMKLKEKAEAGIDVYEIPYKKSSHKKKDQNSEDKKVRTNNNKKKSQQQNKKKEFLKKQDTKHKESSEDGYSSGEESNVEDKSMPKEGKQKPKVEKQKPKNDEEFLEEYDVPVRKRASSVDEGNDSDDSDNYIHLSDTLDDDDLADSSDQDKINDEDHSNAENNSDDESNEAESDGEGVSDDDQEDMENTADEEKSGDESDEMSKRVEDIDENQQGIGCVKIIDNIEMPGAVTVKTGKPLYALIVTPTRELAMQVSGHLKAVAKYSGIRVATIVGGMAAVKQERLLKCGPEIVVATPGRLWELVSTGQPHLQQLDTVKFLAIDETDRMVERNHFQELWPLLERLNADEAKREARQNFVFSATLTLVHDLPLHMTGKKVTKNGKIINRKVKKMTPQQKLNKLINMFGMTDPKVVDITQENLGTAETLMESRLTCSLDEKDVYLYYILQRHPGRTMVFCNAISTVKRLAQLLTILKCRPLPIHASMNQKQRLKNLEKFRDDPHGVLVATDVAARGLDIPDVDHVIHYQVPTTAENYVHRSGRTARGAKEGLTILMMEPSEAYHYTKLCRTLNKTSELPTFPIPLALLSSFKELVSLARHIEVLELRRRRAMQAAGWRERVAKDLDIIIDDDVIPVTKVDTSIDKALKVKKRQLESMLSRPLFPKGFSYKYPTLNEAIPSDGNALQVMKKALESGELKKEKRKGKNASLLKLEKRFKKI